MSKKKQVLGMGIVLVAIMAFAIICGGMGIVLAEGGAGQKISIVHMTDLHYYPTYMCYKQTNADYDKSALAAKSKYESKLVTESSAVIKKMFEDIISRDKMPDYILVTGDLSSDGERVALIDIANALRDLQNKIRAKGNANFQIFVIPGNHDLGGENATDYSVPEGAQTQGVSRADFARIFAGLGYPNMTEAQAELYYADDEFDNNNLKYLPYSSDKRYVHSENAKNIGFKYLAMPDEQQAEQGGLSYMAKVSDGTIFLSLDGVSNGNIGGYIGRNVFDWVNGLSEELSTGNIISLTHHNVLPHFTMQDKWTKNYLYSNWEQVRDFLIGKGVKYNFSGHMHANDVASYCNYDGYNLYDVETGSPVGYGATYREADISFNQDRTSDLYQTYRSIKDVDVKLLLDEGYLLPSMPDTTDIPQSGIVGDVSGYIAERLYDTMLDNVLDNVILQVNKQNFVDRVLGLIEQKLNSIPEFFADYKHSLGVAIGNLYDKIQSQTMQNYVYSGDKEFLQGEQNKLRAKLYEEAKKILNIPIFNGFTVQQLFVEAYTTHLGGGEGRYLSDGNVMEATEWMQSGKLVREVLDIIEQKGGLSHLVQDVLASEYDLSAMLTAKEIKEINIVLAMYDSSLQRFNPDKFIARIFAGKINELPSEFVGSKLQYLANLSIAKGIGGNIAEVIRSLVTDSSYDGVLDVSSKVVYADSDEHSHFAGGKKRAASISDGRLPSMLTMTFGEKIAVDRNFVWLTDKSVLGSDLQYAEGERSDFNRNPKVLVKGSSAVYAVNVPLLDIGIMTTYTTKELARHEVRLTGLKPDKVYSYRVGDSARGYWSEVMTFRTASSEAPFEILVATDNQAMTSAVYEDTAELLKASGEVTELGYDFIFNLGDMVNDGANLNQWRSFLDSGRQVYGSLPQVVAQGNHDVAQFHITDGYIPSSIDVIMNKYSAMQLHYAYDKNYYSFDYKGVHFVVLDTNDITENNNLSFEQIEWLTNDLQRNKDNLVVVGMHKAIYSAGPHQNDEDVIKMRGTLTKLFSEYGVELVLQGHDHIYSESFFLDKNGNRLNTPPYRQGAPINNNGGGVLYITMGAVGDKFYDFDMNTDSFINKGKMFHSPRLKSPTFGRLVFDGQNISFYSYQYNVETGEISQLKLFNNNQVAIIISVIAAVVIVLGIGAVLFVMLKRHKKAIAKCKEENAAIVCADDGAEQTPQKQEDDIAQRPEE